jgi:hypothetical protein
MCMKSFEVWAVGTVLTFVLFMGGIQFDSAEIAYGQSNNQTRIK